MSVYDHYISDAFPVLYIVHKSTAERWAKFLITADEYAPNGSSFAITSDTSKQNNRKIWLSSVSVQRLKQAGLIEGGAWTFHT